MTDNVGLDQSDSLAMSFQGVYNVTWRSTSDWSICPSTPADDAELTDQAKTGQ